MLSPDSRHFVTVTLETCSDILQALARTLPWIRGDGPVAAPMYNGTFFPQNPAFDLQAKLNDPLTLA